MKHFATGLLALFSGSVLIWHVVRQHRTGEKQLGTVLDIVAGIFPPLRTPLFWVSTAFFVFLAAVGLIVACISFMLALGLV